MQGKQEQVEHDFVTAVDAARLNDSSEPSQTVNKRTCLGAESGAASGIALTAQQHANACGVRGRATAPGPLPARRVRAVRQADEESGGDAELRDHTPVAFEARVAVEVERRLGAEFESRVKMEVDKRTEVEVSRRVQSELDARVSAEVARRVAEEIERRVEAELKSEKVQHMVAEHVEQERKRLEARLAEDVRRAHEAAIEAERKKKEEELAERERVRRAVEETERRVREEQNALAVQVQRADEEHLREVECRARETEESARRWREQQDAEVRKQQKLLNRSGAERPRVSFGLGNIGRPPGAGL